MADTTCLNASLGEETHSISTTMTPENLFRYLSPLIYRHTDLINSFSHDTMPSSINSGDRRSRGSSSPTYSQSDILELQRISAASNQAFGEENFDNSSTTPLMLNPLISPLTVQHRTIAPKSGPSTPSQQIRSQCPSCDRSFNRPTDRERHMGIHSKERKFACPEPGCGKRFYRKDKLGDHSRRGHRNRKQTCICMTDGSGEVSFRPHSRPQDEKLTTYARLLSDPSPWSFVGADGFPNELFRGGKYSSTLTTSTCLAFSPFLVFTSLHRPG